MNPDLMDDLSKERPVGSSANTEILGRLEELLKGMGYGIQSLPFECKVWENGISFLKINDNIIEVKASPFSEPFDGERPAVFVRSLEELRICECNDRILVMCDEIVSDPLQPKDYPFYYPDEHKALIELLESKHPAAIIAATGRNALCGMDPFPLFEDGNFTIPSAYVSKGLLHDDGICECTRPAHLSIRSQKKEAASRQIVASKKADDPDGKIVICAHMDSKYDTLGALDNAAGVAVLLEAAMEMSNESYDIDVVPFNGEEYYEASGEVEYLKFIEQNDDDVALVINIDSPCHTGSRIGVSFYNFDDRMKTIADELAGEQPRIEYGQEWYAGDHAAFAFDGTPCIAVTSSDIFEGALDDTHTMRDTVDNVDLGLVRYAADFVSGFVRSMSKE